MSRSSVISCNFTLSVVTPPGWFFEPVISADTYIESAQEITISADNMPASTFLNFFMVVRFTIPSPPNIFILEHIATMLIFYHSYFLKVKIHFFTYKNVPFV